MGDENWVWNLFWLMQLNHPWVNKIQVDLNCQPTLTSPGPSYLPPNAAGLTPKKKIHNFGGNSKFFTLFHTKHKPSLVSFFFLISLSGFFFSHQTLKSQSTHQSSVVLIPASGTNGNYLPITFYHLYILVIYSSCSAIVLRA